MENASKALIMAAEVLLGVMIISIAVYLFNTFGQYSAETNKKITDAQIAEFNNKFLKFYGEIVNDEGKLEPIKCTIHDIVSLANLAIKNNTEYDLTKEEGKANNTLYIQIDLKIGSKKMQIEKYENEKDRIDLIKENDIIIHDDGTTEVKYFKCTNYEINEDTKRVNYMKFEEI